MHARPAIHAESRQSQRQLLNYQSSIKKSNNYPLNFHLDLWIITNVALLPSGHIDNEAFFDNFHLNNEKGSRILANNTKLFLGFKSKREQRQQRLSTSKQRRQPKQLYAETTSTNPHHQPIRLTT